MAPLLIGLALLAFAVAVWTGLLRSAQSAPLWRNAAWTVVPGFGLLLLAYGLERIGAVSSRSPIGPIAFVLALVGFVLGLWNPSWFGPRWYRQQRRER